MPLSPLQELKQPDALDPAGVSPVSHCNNACPNCCALETTLAQRAKATIAHLEGEISKARVILAAIAVNRPIVITPGDIARVTPGIELVREDDVLEGTITFRVRQPGPPNPEWLNFDDDDPEA